MSQLWAVNLFGVLASVISVPVFMFCIYGAVKELPEGNE